MTCPESALGRAVVAGALDEDEDGEEDDAVDGLKDELTTDARGVHG